MKTITTYKLDKLEEELIRSAHTIGERNRIREAIKSFKHPKPKKTLGTELSRHAEELHKYERKMEPWEQDVWKLFGQYDSDNGRCLGVVRMESPEVITNFIRKQVRHYFIAEAVYELEEVEKEINEICESNVHNGFAVPHSLLMLRISVKNRINHLTQEAWKD